MRLALKFCWTRVADTAKRLLAAYSGREVANAKTDRPLRRMITLLRVDVGSVGKKHRFSLFFSNGTLGKVLERLGGRTRARTWDPLIKSQLRVKNNQ
jgi:hypothetical protein